MVRERELTALSETLKHIKSINKERKESSQPSILMALSNQSSKEDDRDKELLKVQTKDLEIGLTQFMSRHNIAPQVAECLTDILKKFIVDSEIIRNMRLGREKAWYLMEYGISEEYEEKAIKKLRECDAFSIGIDESEVNKRSELEITANLSTKENGIEKVHYQAIDLEGGDAEVIAKSVLDPMIMDNIDYKAKMIDAGVDGCAVMLGKKSGVIKRLQEEVPQLLQ